MARYRVETEGGTYEVETEDAPALPPSVLDQKPPAPTPGQRAGQATSDFLSGAWSMASPVTAVKGLAQAVMHPIDTAAGIVQSHVDTGAKAAQSMQSGDYLQGVRHALNTIIPLIGPMLDQSQEKIRGGNAAEGLGEIVGMAAAPAVLRGTAQAGRAAAQGAKAAVGAVKANPRLATAAAGMASPRIAYGADFINEVRAIRAERAARNAPPPEAPAAPRPGATPPAPAAAPPATWDYSAPPQTAGRAVPQPVEPVPVAPEMPVNQAPQTAGPLAPTPEPYVPVDPAAGLDPAIVQQMRARRVALDQRSAPPEMRPVPDPPAPTPDPLGVRPIGNEAAGLADIPVTGAEKIKRARARMKAKEAQSFDERLQKLVERSRKMEPTPEAKAVAGVAEEAPPKFKGEPLREPTDAELADALQRSLDEVHARKLSHRTGVPAASTPEGAAPAKPAKAPKPKPAPAADEDLTALLQQSIDAVNARKGGAAATSKEPLPVAPVAEAVPEMAAQPQESSASWILRNKETGEVIAETFDKKKVDALNTAKYEAVPIMQYLQEFNAKVKAAGGVQPPDVPPVKPAAPEAPPVAAVPESAPARAVKRDDWLGSQGKAKGVAPWEMSGRDWHDSFFGDRAETFDTRNSRSGAKETQARIERKRKLKFGLGDVWDEDLQQYDSPTHKMVVKKALDEGITVPESVLAEYPDLTPTASPAAAPPAPAAKLKEARASVVAKRKAKLTAAAQPAQPAKSRAQIEAEAVAADRALESSMESRRSAMFEEYRKAGKTERDLHKEMMDIEGNLSDAGASIEYKHGQQNKWYRGGVKPEQVEQWQDRLADLSAVNRMYKAKPAQPAPDPLGVRPLGREAEAVADMPKVKSSVPDWKQEYNARRKQAFDEYNNIDEVDVPNERGGTWRGSFNQATSGEWNDQKWKASLSADERRAAAIDASKRANQAKNDKAQEFMGTYWNSSQRAAAEKSLRTKLPGIYTPRQVMLIAEQVQRAEQAMEAAKAGRLLDLDGFSPALKKQIKDLAKAATSGEKR